MVYLVSYLLVPTSNLKVGAKLRGPSWKPFKMGQVLLAMLSCGGSERQMISLGLVRHPEMGGADEVKGRNLVLTG